MATVAELGDLIVAQLGTITNLTVFDGVVDEDGVVKDQGVTRPYAVLYMSPGSYSSQRMAGRAEQFSVTGQITVAAGTVAGFRWAAGRVMDTLTDHRLEPLNRGSTPFRFDEDPGPERRDEDDPSDVRWHAPLHFTFTTTRS